VLEEVDTAAPAQTLRQLLHPAVMVETVLIGSLWELIMQVVAEGEATNPP
jgi:hypothetical protein